MGRKRCYKTSHTSRTSIWEWEETHVMKHNSTTSIWEWEVTHVIKYHIPLQINDGKGKKKML